MDFHNSRDLRYNAIKLDYSSQMHSGTKSFGFEDMSCGPMNLKFKCTTNTFQ